MRRGRAVVSIAAIAVILCVVAFALGCGEGAPSYRLTVTFNTSVTQAGMDEVSGLLREFDSGADMLVTETFPPVGHVTLKTDAPDFCGRIESDLGKLSFVQNVTCELLDGGGDGG